MLSTLKTALKTLCVLYVCVCALMWAGQRVLMYHPFRSLADPKHYGLEDFTDVRLKDKDGTHITAWYHAARLSYPTIVFFHGNGGNLTSRTHYFHALTDIGFGMLAIDYRGYGASEGSPSEQGFYQDARAALGYATDTLRLPLNRIVLYGESIGTGVAVQMATEFPVGAIVLQSPYTSTEKIASERYWWMPVHLLMKDTFDSLSKIANVHAPLLVLHGEVDTIVPVEEGRALFAHANEPKDAVYFPSKGHNDMAIAERIQPLLVFSHKQRLIQSQ